MLIGIIGGRSRSGAAFQRFLETNAPDVAYRSIVRAPAADASGPLAHERVVDDYARLGSEALRGCAAVVNFVGAVAAPTPGELDHVNVAVPQALAAAAAEAGVGQFVQISSLSLYGPRKWIDGQAPCDPAGDYGRTKLAAEHAIAHVAPPELVTTMLRLPAIYGPGAPSKLATLAAILGKLPIFPVPARQPRRSVISHENLSRTLLHVIRNRLGGVLHAADPQPFTLDMMAQVIPSPPRMIAVPGWLLRPISLVAPGAYSSLYESSEIAPELLLDVPGLVPTRDALEAAFGQRG